MPIFNGLLEFFPVKYFLFIRKQDPTPNNHGFEDPWSKWGGSEIPNPYNHGMDPQQMWEKTVSTKFEVWGKANFYMSNNRLFDGSYWDDVYEE